MGRIRLAASALMGSAIALTANKIVVACTAFCAVGGGQILVGNNEDFTNPRTRIWFVAAKPGSYGRMYVGFDELHPQGGMNERGLWFDGFAVALAKSASPSDLPRFEGNLIDAAMARCKTVEEVVRLFSQYDRAFLSAAILMFADASGDAVSIERDAIVRKTGPHFVQTNFRQSRPREGLQDERFEIASRMLDRAGGDISVDLVRQILIATHQRGASPTLYSNIYELKSRTMHLYYFRDFERAVTFQLDEELKKGERVLDIPSLFPRNAAAEKFAARPADVAPSGPGPGLAIGLIAVPVLVIAVALLAWVRGGRRVRVGLGLLGAAAIVSVVVPAVTLRMHRQASDRWAEFSIGPAAGRSSSIQPNAMRSSGMTLKTAIAVAYDVPSVRVIGPEWLAQTRYSINAAVSPEASDAFRSLLQQELARRLHLETHFEVRPFDTFVLTASDASRLERAHRTRPRVWVGDWGAQLENASLTTLAGALQNILGKSVVDHTGITGTYHFELEWTADRLPSLRAALRNGYGLELTPTTQQMEALVVDRIQRDAAMVLLAQIGRITSRTPPEIGERIADILAIR